MYIAFGDKTWDTWRAGTRQVLFPVTDKAIARVWWWNEIMKSLLKIIQKPKVVEKLKGLSY